MRTALSVVIITFNEEHNISRCIHSVSSVADEVIVLDSFSTDQTPAICLAIPNVRFVQHKWEGYSAQKNRANAMASNDWILSIDADEVLSEELMASVITWKERPVPAGFNRLTNYAGKWIHHGGWYPDFKFRLFNRRNTRWEGIIHEQLVSDVVKANDIVRLKGDCLHYSFSTPHDHEKQTDKFSRLWAHQAYANKRSYSFLKRVFGPIIRFIRDYFLLAGMRDGLAGMKIALVSAKAIAERQRYLKALIDGRRID